MSIRWIRNVNVDGEPATLELFLGESHISDKCYFKINNSTEHWFNPKSQIRDEIIKQGISLFKKHLEGKNVTSTSGQPFNWS